jgi:hypothetical protein
MSARVEHEAVLTVGLSEQLLRKQLLAISNLENLTMRSLTLTGAAMLAAALLTGCTGDDAPTAPTAENIVELTADSRTVNHFSFTEPLDDIVISPCNGEMIHVTGTITEQGTIVEVDGVGLHVEVQDVVSGTGTGLTTGVIYRTHNTNHQSFNSPTAAAVNFTATFWERFYFITQTPGLSFTGRFFVHVLATPSGDFKATREVDSLECRS